MNGCRKLVSSIIILTFIVSTITPYKTAQAANVDGLPIPGAMVNLSTPYVPMMIKGLRVHPENPLLFDFIVDTGNSSMKTDSKDLRAQSETLIKYFLASLTIPEKDMWVNLSPYEKERIIEQPLGETELGRTMLAQDYILKQLTASLIYPEKELGKKFWDKIYAQAREQFGANVNVPVNTFNKVWILPDQADIFVRNNTAFVVGAHLKVMMEEDYLATQKHSVVKVSNKLKDQSAAVIRQVILPEIEKEVNQGKNFAPLRQIFNSIILASWYKKNLKEALLNQVYANKSKIDGVTTNDRAIKEKIYEQYLQAYKKGVFNYIKDTDTQGMSEPRKYFSGGLVFDVKPRTVRDVSPAMTAALIQGDVFDIKATVANAAMVSDARIAELKEAVAAALSVLKDEARTKALNDGAITLKAISDRFEEIRNSNDNNAILPQLLGMLEEIKAVVGDQAMSNEKVGYNGQALLKDVQEIVEGYRNAGVKIDEVKGYLSPNIAGYLGIQAPVRTYIIETQGQVETFGVASIKNDTDSTIDLYVERGFLNLVAKRQNPNRMLERALVYALSQGTHEEKRVAEFNYFLNAPDPLLGKLTNEQVKEALKGMDVVGLFDYFVSQIPELFDPVLGEEMTKRFKQSLWEIAVNRLNKDAREIRVITKYDDDPLGAQEKDQGDAHVVYFPLAANPLHFGQVETALRAMAQSKADQGIFRVQGVDFRKPMTKATQKDRHELTAGFVQQVDNFAPGLFAYSSTGLGNDLDGESDFIKFLRLNQGRKGGVLRADYLVGSDHMHYFAPDFDRWKKAAKAGVDEAVNPKPGSGPEGFQPDTIQKFESFASSNREFLADNQIEFRVLFNERDPFESKPIPAEINALERIAKSGTFYQLLRGVNLEGASSTLLRNALSGFGKAQDLTIMPMYIRNLITERAKYRGLITDLPASILRIANGNSQEHDLYVLRGWLNIEKQQGRTHSDEEIAEMFTLSDNPISNEQVALAIKAVNNNSGDVDSAMSIVELGNAMEKIARGRVVSEAEAAGVKRWLKENPGSNAEIAQKLNRTEAFIGIVKARTESLDAAMLTINAALGVYQNLNVYNHKATQHTTEVIEQLRVQFPSYFVKLMSKISGDKLRGIYIAPEIKTDRLIAWINYHFYGVGVNAYPNNGETLNIEMVPGYDVGYSTPHIVNSLLSIIALKTRNLQETMNGGGLTEPQRQEFMELKTEYPEISLSYLDEATLRSIKSRLESIDSAMSFQDIKENPNSARLTALILKELAYVIKKQESVGVVKTYYGRVAAVDQEVFNEIARRYQEAYREYLDVAQDRQVDTINVRFNQRQAKVSPADFKQRVLDIIVSIQAELPSDEAMVAELLTSVFPNQRKGVDLVRILLSNIQGFRAHRGNDELEKKMVVSDNTALPVSLEVLEEFYRWLDANFGSLIKIEKGASYLISPTESGMTREVIELKKALQVALDHFDAAQATGGIDLNTKNMTTNVTGEKIDIRFDRAMIESFKRGDFTGVRPVILNVTPIQSVLPLLGLAQRREDDVALGV